MIYEGYSEVFQEFYYWFISDKERPSVARARHDVPIELVTKLSGEELESAKQLIFQKFDGHYINGLHIQALTELNDKRAIPYIERQYKDYKERQKGYPACDFSWEIELCKIALKKLRYS